MPAWSKEMWDFRSSGMLRSVTSQKSEELIYCVAEGWKHDNSKYVLLFDSACSWAYSSLYCLYFWGGFHLHLIFCSAVSWQFYPFLKLWSVSLATILLFGGEGENLTFRRRNFLLNFSTPVFKMWIIQEPKKVTLWNERQFEEEKTENVQHV